VPIRAVKPPATHLLPLPPLGVPSQGSVPNQRAALSAVRTAPELDLEPAELELSLVLDVSPWKPTLQPAGLLPALAPREKRSARAPVRAAPALRPAPLTSVPNSRCRQARPGRRQIGRAGALLATRRRPSTDGLGRSHQGASGVTCVERTCDMFGGARRTGCAISRSPRPARARGAAVAQVARLTTVPFRCAATRSVIHFSGALQLGSPQGSVECKQAPRDVRRGRDGVR
jgi:hypothetical protein